MPLSGTENILKQQVRQAALNILKATMEPKLPPDADFPVEDLEAIADAIAEGVVITMQHIAANAQVTPGIPVATAGSPTSQVGATTSPGVLL